MLEKYRKVLESDSLVSVVPKRVLQSLMQGFFYGFHAGMVLIYDEGKGANGKPLLKRLDPMETKDKQSSKDWREKNENFNPFCAKFREKPERDAMCEACDLKYAHMTFSGTQKECRHTCHMGLIDMTIPIKVGDVIRGVIFAGQKIISGDEKQLAHIRSQIKEKSPDIKDELERLLLSDSAVQEGDSITLFEQGFVKFADSLQTTVEAFNDVRRLEAEREALLEISEEVGQTMADDAATWTKSIAPLFEELQAFVGHKPIWLLQRRGSRYQCVAASSLGESAVGVNLSVAALITTPVEKLAGLPNSPLALREMMEKLDVKVSELTLIRSDTPISQTDIASVILVIGTNMSIQFERFMTACVRALAYPAGVTGLFHRLDKQSSDFARRASFIGHHLKTPLQAALFSIRDTMLVADNSPDGHAERQQLLKDVQTQISRGLADALRLQGGAISPKKERFDLYKMLETLVDDVRPLARPKNVELRLETRPSFSCLLYGVPFHIRIAFSNLLDNAIKYSFENKWIDIRFSKITSDPSVRKRAQDTIAVEIEDAGVGFPSKQKDLLFSFGTRLDEASGMWARSGAGIGLSQAKEYIEEAGGSLDIDSQSPPVRQGRSGSISKVTVMVHLPIA